MAYDEKLAERVRRVFTTRKVKFKEKPMMGGLCFLVADKMCVGVEQDRLMVRLDPEIYATALKRKGAKPMDFTGRPLRGFIFVHSPGFTSKRDLTTWLDLALEFNPKAKSSKKRRAHAEG